MMIQKTSIILIQYLFDFISFLMNGAIPWMDYPPYPFQAFGGQWATAPLFTITKEDILAI